MPDENLKMVINGQMYTRIEDVPEAFREQVRQTLDDARKGTPGSQVEVRRSYKVNGVEYNSLEDMPPDLRGIFEDRDGDGVPDLLQHLNTQGTPTRLDEPSVQATVTHGTPLGAAFRAQGEGSSFFNVVVLLGIGLLLGFLLALWFLR